MTEQKRKEAELIEDEQLEEASGGGTGPRLSEAAAQGHHLNATSTPVSILGSTSAGKATKSAGDGSV